MLEAQEPQVQSLGQEDPLEEGMATHSSIPAWRIPWTEEPGGLQSMGLRRVGHGRNDSAQYGPSLSQEMNKYSTPGAVTETAFIYLFFSFIFISWRLITL